MTQSSSLNSRSVSTHSTLPAETKTNNLRHNKQVWLDLVAGKAGESTAQPEEMNEKEAYAANQYDCESSVDNSLFTSNSSTGSASKNASLYSASTKNISNGQKTGHRTTQNIPQILGNPTFTSKYEDSDSLSSGYLLNGPIQSIMDPSDSILNHQKLSSPQATPQQKQPSHTTLPSAIHGSGHLSGKDAKRGPSLSSPQNDTDSSTSGSDDIDKAHSFRMNRQKKRAADVACCGIRAPLPILLIIAFSLFLFVFAGCLVISQIMIRKDGPPKTTSEQGSLAPNDWDITSYTREDDSEFPSMKPSDAPSSFPSSYSTSAPSNLPISQDTSGFPSMKPSNAPSHDKSNFPSMRPSNAPYQDKSNFPSMEPSDAPYQDKSNFPSMRPSRGPSSFPSDYPTSTPSYLPTRFSQRPSISPSFVNPYHTTIISARQILNTIVSALDDSWNDTMLVTKETLYSTLDDTWDKVRSNGTTDYQGALLDAQSFIETLKQFQAQVKDADKKIAKSLKDDFDFLENEADELVRLLQGAI